MCRNYPIVGSNKPSWIGIYAILTWWISRPWSWTKLKKALRLTEGLAQSCWCPGITILPCDVCWVWHPVQRRLLPLKNWDFANCLWSGSSPVTREELYGVIAIWFWEHSSSPTLWGQFCVLRTHRRDSTWQLCHDVGIAGVGRKAPITDVGGHTTFFPFLQCAILPATGPLHMSLLLGMLSPTILHLIELIQRFTFSENLP